VAVNRLHHIIAVQHSTVDPPNPPAFHPGHSAGGQPSSRSRPTGVPHQVGGAGGQGRPAIKDVSCCRQLPLPANAACLALLVAAGY
jgi:hypothetical protein